MSFVIFLSNYNIHFIDDFLYSSSNDYIDVDDEFIVVDVSYFDGSGFKKFEVIFDVSYIGSDWSILTAKNSIFNKKFLLKEYMNTISNIRVYIIL